ncbi:hypothetical protein HPB47_003082 [Ixodes persulcatus]|uniref:Uncharacterized protein n=1 Tax=Ixodes persulcatus TaxID=34615 RepID=A0AC60PJE8_IXOPE|nr:hypothetical protein HPB47_003082 [Ixodes persulcatus]
MFARSGPRRSFRGSKQGQFLPSREAVNEWVREQRSKSLSVSYEDIEGKARAVANEMEIDRSNFKI